MQAYGLANVWLQGDLVTRGILITLLIMSVLSWTVIVVKLWNVLRVRRMMRRATTAFWRAGRLEEGLEALGAGPAAGRNPSENPFLALALAGRDAAAHHRETTPHLQDRIDVSDWITRGLQDAMDESVARLQAGLAVLASIGSTSPFVGLFGTVWGIYHALLAIGSTGETSIGQVAGPVGESLIMTALGLAVAIPAVLGYNGLTRANRGVVTQLKRFAHDLHTWFVTGAPLSSRLGAGARRPGGLDDDGGLNDDELNGAGSPDPLG